MKNIDVEALLLPENNEELETQDLNTYNQANFSRGKYNSHLGYSSLVKSVLDGTKPPQPVKRFSKEEIFALEKVMKKQGRL